jgi:hypothetical protein
MNYANNFSIIAVHGLGAIPSFTWKAKGAELSWLEDPNMLPSEMPHARILRYGYNSIWFGQMAVKTSVKNVAQALSEAIRSERQAFPNRPFILIGHCFGGLVIEQV